LETEAITVPSTCPSGTFKNVDCNFNGVNDFLELRSNPSLDSNSNSLLDECEVDCNSNGVFDYIDIQNGTSRDMNDNHIPDECEPDCNGNGIPDEIDIMYHVSLDANKNSIPDECEVPHVSPTQSPTPSQTPSYEPQPQVYESPAATPSILPTPSVTPSILPSPEPLPSCDGVICENGQCQNETGRCSCDNGWLGRHCDIPDCNFKGIYNMYMEYCHCYPGWTGTRCDQCARSVDTHPERIYLCCPAYGESNKYSLVLIPEGKKQDYLNGVYTTPRCELQNATFANGNSLDCSCRFSEASSGSSESSIRTSFALKNKLGNIIQDYREMDFESYTMTGLMVYNQMVVEELSENYPMQLANAIEETVVSFVDETSTSCNQGWTIALAVILPSLVLVGIAFVFYCAFAKSGKHHKKKKKKAIKYRYNV
jgi:hypothetical protein